MAAVLIAALPRVCYQKNFYAAKSSALIQNASKFHAASVAR